MLPFIKKPGEVFPSCRKPVYQALGPLHQVSNIGFFGDYLEDQIFVHSVHRFPTISQWFTLDFGDILGLGDISFAKLSEDIFQTGFFLNEHGVSKNPPDFWSNVFASSQDWKVPGFFNCGRRFDGDRPRTKCLNEMCGSLTACPGDERLGDLSTLKMWSRR